MPNYLITYFGGNHPANPDDAKKHFAEYQQWLASLADAVVSPANPLKAAHTIRPDATTTPGSATAMSGYTIIQADSIQAAIKLAKSCPFLRIDGTLEVAELIQMPNA